MTNIENRPAALFFAAIAAGIYTKCQHWLCLIGRLTLTMGCCKSKPLKINIDAPADIEAASVTHTSAIATPVSPKNISLPSFFPTPKFDIKRSLPVVIILPMRNSPKYQPTPKRILVKPCTPKIVAKDDLFINMRAFKTMDSGQSPLNSSRGESPPKSARRSW